MTAFRVAHCAARSCAEAARACVAELLAAGPLAGPGAALGFVYASDAFAGEFASLVTYLRGATGVEQWVGTLGMGVLATGKEYFDEPALAVMVASLPESSFRVFPTVADSLSSFRAANGAWIKEKQPALAVVHGDPSNQRLGQVLEGLTEEASCFLVGGLTSSRGAMSQVAGQVTAGGVSGVLFSSELALLTGLSQGCAPIGPMHTITACSTNVLFELDDRPALEVFKEDARALIERHSAAAASSIHAALPIRGSDTGDYLVRNLVGADPARGWLAIAGEPESGDEVMFCRRDEASARHDLAHMLERLAARAKGAARGAVYYSCVARGPHLFGPGSAELGLLRDALGEVPLVGFFCNGEISNARLYGYTGVLALFL